VSLREVDGDPALAPVLTMVVEHELMHHETLLYMVQQLARALKVRPSWLPSPGVGRDVTMERVSVPAGQAVLGAPRGDSFLWDNERPEQVVEVGAFRIDSLPVTNSELLRFVHAGGYEDRRLWTDDAWRWLGHRGRRLPELWRHGPEGLRVLTLFDERPFEEAARWPASVAQCEAAAYARWRGGRLPTEAELHRAAFATPKGETREHPWGGAPPTAEHGNLGFRSWEPTAGGSHPAGTSAFGVQELVGNGWEWTSTPFGPLRGFEPLARYPGYSADFFDGRHFVMLGASWATDVRLVRRSFRNWFQPHYPYVFSKFRCVWPA
jgi:ergothioneine biosynthesis protein EgtB